MERGYFLTAWDDMRAAKNWFGKLLLLGLISLIPVFGQVVLLGYAYGWARDIAWGVKSAMPATIFGNEDGRIWLRGFFLLVLAAVCVLVPLIVVLLFNVLFVQGADTLMNLLGTADAIQRMLLGTVNALILAVYYVLTLVAIPFVLVGWMRIAVYGRLSAGFQVTKVWAMMRKEFNGLLRIVGMVFFFLLLFGAVVLLICLALGLFGGLMAVAALATGQGLDLAYLVGDLLPAAIVSLLVVLYVGSVINATAVVIVARASGYWTHRFDVPRWRGQDDSMPFERPAPPPESAARE